MTLGEIVQSFFFLHAVVMVLFDHIYFFKVNTAEYYLFSDL